jgi:hypothetical protein
MQEGSLLLSLILVAGIRKPDYQNELWQSGDLMEVRERIRPVTFRPGLTTGLALSKYLRSSFQ